MMASDVDATLVPVPELYAGKYRLLREIGKGGMGSVFEAVEIALDRIVAVKRLTAEIGGTLEARQRFRRELKAAARLSHAGIAQVLGYGTTEEGQHYIAMELVSGEPLRRELERARSVRDVLALFDQILGVLAYAHARGVVHRDLKPENIIVARVGAAPVCKLLDFGVARTEADRNPASTVPASALPQKVGGASSGAECYEIVGTPGYMAPEQVRGERAGSAADLYAVGVMLFEVLTGGRPIQGRGDEVMARKLVESAPPVETTRFGSVSSALAQLVAQLLERDPALRLAVAADARALLARCAEASVPDAGSISTRGPASSSDAFKTVRVVESSRGSVQAIALPFVGRRVELRRLDDAFRQVTSGIARLVLIEGPAGIGKSHLVDCFAQRVIERGGCTVLGGSYVEAGGPEGDGIRSALERHIGSWGKGREAVRRLVSRYLDRYGEADADEALALTDWLRPSATFAARNQQEGRLPYTIALVERILRRIAAGRPLVLTLDDLQWGGRGAFETLSFFLAMWRQEPAPVLVIATLLSPIEDRDLLQVYRKLMVHGGEQVQRIPLEPLSHEDAAKVILAITGDRAISRVGSIVERAAGNPLFAIQLARLARNAAETSADRSSAPLPDPKPGSQLPASVQELLEARLDAAAARSKDPDTAIRVLSGIALLLPPTPTMLVELALIDSGISPTNVRASLDELVEMGIVRERLLEGAEAIDFEHPLLAEVLRARMSPRTIRRQSAQVLALKEAHFGPARDRVLYQLAEHAHLAGLSERARELALAAARQALDAGRHGEAMGLLKRLMEDGARESSQSTDVALLASRIADETGDLPLSESLLTPLLQGENQGALLAALALARQRARIGRIAEAAVATDRAEAIAHLLGERGEPIGSGDRTETLRLRASIARRMGRFDDAIRLLEQALSEDPDAPADRARLLFDNLAWARHRAGDKAGALLAARRALDLSGPGLDRGWALRSVAVIGSEHLSIAERCQKLQQALAIARERGALRLLASALTHLGNLERAVGDPAALSHFRQVLQIGPDYVDDEDLSESLASLAMMLVESGEPHEAAEHLQQRERRRSSWENALRLVTAAVASARGDGDAAASEVVLLREGVREIPSSWGVARAAERLAVAFSQADRPDLARWAEDVAASAWARAGWPETSLGTKPPENTEPTLENTR